MTDEPTIPIEDRPVTREAAVIELFDHEYRSLVGMARVLVDTDAEAEEVVQESFTRLYASFRRLDDRGRALAYLRSIVLNQARGRLRRRRTARENAHLVTRDLHVEAADLTDVDRHRVRAAVRGLPRRQQQCVVLQHYYGCSEQEIADTLGIGNGSVKKHLHRAKSRLTSELEELA